MDGANSHKKMKVTAKNKKRKGAKLPEAEKTEIVVPTSPEDIYEGKISVGKSDKKKNKHKNKLKEQKRNKENRREDAFVPNSNDVGDSSDQQSDDPDGANSRKKMKKVAKNKKRKAAKQPEVETTEIVVSTSPDDVYEGKNSTGMSDKKNNKLKKKKRNKGNRTEDDIPHVNEVGDDSNQHSGKSNSLPQLKTDASLLDDEDEVYQISSGDEDETTGMRRWISEYQRARPGAQVLLQRIDDYFVDYWSQKEEEKKEKEAEAAEGGWTVVTHVKGRKKTTDAESGTTMGSVAQAAVMDKMSKKKNKQVGLSFYRFQRREAQRNEIMMLQSKFEQDKKRIQQLRAARKFKPY